MIVSRSVSALLRRHGVTGAVFCVALRALPLPALPLPALPLPALLLPALLLPALLLQAVPLHAALLQGAPQQAEDAPRGPESLQVFHLKNVAQTNEASSIVTALRNVLNPGIRVFLVTETNDIVMSAPADQLAIAGRVIAQLDHPKATYRVTYTLTESDSGKRVGLQHFSMVVVTGQKVVLKQGDKVPVITGSFSTEKNAQQTQFTYLDVGTSLDTTLEPFANGLRLRSRVEQSSVAEAPAGGKAVDDPIVRQSLLEGTSVIVPGKALNLGGIDIVGSTRHMDVEVMAEPLP